MVKQQTRVAAKIQKTNIKIGTQCLHASVGEFSQDSRIVNRSINKLEKSMQTFQRKLTKN